MPKRILYVVKKKKLLKKTVLDPKEIPSSLLVGNKNALDLKRYINIKDLFTLSHYPELRKKPEASVKKICEACFNRIETLLPKEKGRIYKDKLYEKILATIYLTELMEHTSKSKYSRGKRYIRLSNVLNTCPIQRVRERKREILDNLATTIIKGFAAYRVLKKEGNFYRKYPSKTLPKHVGENHI